MDKVFINEAFNKAINDYLGSNENIQGLVYNSFLVVVVRLLICIYGELDIINPKMALEEDLLKNNLAKFGYKKENIEEFFNQLGMFYETDKSQYFISVQKMLVDMFIQKKLNFVLTDNEVEEFYDLLYTPNAKNPLRISYNYLMASDPYEIDNYFKNAMKNNIKKVLPKEKPLINSKAYEVLGYEFDKVKDLDNKEIERINNQIYAYFKIRENAINKEYLLEKALEDLEKENSKITSGNGYVDILLILSIIFTVIMLAGIVTFIVF